MTDAADWVRGLEEWKHSMHRARLERAFWSLPQILDGDGERAVHSLSRLGVWATHLAEALDFGEVDSKEVAEQLRKLGEAGGIAFKRSHASDAER